MYSVVLMMALSGGAESTDFGHRKGCNGCDGGCTGAVVASCDCGGKKHGGFLGGLFHHKPKCSGCTGDAPAPACSGSTPVSCDGGCSGGHKRHFGGLFHRKHGCNGGGCTGSEGCTGSAGCTGGCAGSVVVPSTTEPKKDMPKEMIPTPPAKKVQSTTRATIVVTLPADAQLTVDGNSTVSNSDRRVFVTPELQTGATFAYTFQVEVVRDGRTMTETQRVVVQGGETTNVPFNFSTETVASR